MSITIIRTGRFCNCPGINTLIWQVLDRHSIVFKGQPTFGDGYSTLKESSYIVLQGGIAEYKNVEEVKSIMSKKFVKVVDFDLGIHVFAKCLLEQE